MINTSEGSEIITFQFGNYSNHVGTHYWNTEIEYEQRVGAQKNTAFRDNGTPRVLIFDTKAKLSGVNDSHSEVDVDYGSLFGGTVFEQGNNAVLWGESIKRVEKVGGRVSGYRRAMADWKSVKRGKDVNDLIEEKRDELKIVSGKVKDVKMRIKGGENMSKKLQKLEEEELGIRKDISRLNVLSKNSDLNQISVQNSHLFEFGLDNSNNWTDFNNVKYSDKSINECPFGTYDDVPVNIWSYGNSLYQDQEEDFLDNVRYLAEECDLCQGFQVLVDIETTFGSLATNILQDIKDDFPRLPIATHAFYGAAPTEMNAKSNRAVNLALSLSGLYEISTAFIPLSSKDWKPEDFPSLNLNPENKYQSSAIFSSAIDTLYSHRFSSRNYMSDYFKFSNTSSKLCSVEATFPFSMERESNLEETLSSYFLPLNTSPMLAPLTPNVIKMDGNSPYFSNLHLRGEMGENAEFLMENMFYHEDFPVYPSHTNHGVYTPLSFPSFFEPNNGVKYRGSSSIPLWATTMTHLQVTPHLAFPTLLLNQFQKLRNTIYIETQDIDYTYHLENLERIKDDQTNPQ